MMQKTKFIFFTIVLSFSMLFAQARDVGIEKTSLVGKSIVEFIPSGFDQSKTPSLILKGEPAAIGSIPADWTLIPQFSLINEKVFANLIHRKIPLWFALFSLQKAKCGV